MEVDLSVALEQLRRIAFDLIRLLPNLLIAALVFALFFLIGRWVRSLVRSVNQRRSGDHTLGMVLGRLAQWGILLLGLLTATTILLPSFRPGDLITLLGVGGVAIGFAFKDIFQNFLAGILILLTRPFRVGDQIVVGDLEGTVEEIQTRATMLRTYDNRRVVIPNSDLYTDKVIVNTAYEQKRSEYDVGIGYGDDVDLARRLILETVREVEGVRQNPAPDVLLVDLAASTVNLRVRWWTNPDRASVLEVQDRVLRRVKAVLTENGIDLPYDTQVVLFHDQTEATDGDRNRQREGWPAGKADVPDPHNVPRALASLSEAARERPSADGKPADRERASAERGG